KGWALARDLRQVMLKDLYQSAAYVIPDRDELVDIPMALEELLESLNLTLEQSMDRPLEELLHEQHGTAD
ncbi:MAG: hypothetical protein N0E54_10845, partial [Candidatus Thiodiazotropha taylori]|nr:hypothetical protein [Candidatus Thiodiazotropha endolucinida]MCW4229226.1 hypothetical protein [Candidatus Thiodiazotropha taylori]